mgnify:CR=1 FL=1
MITVNDGLVVIVFGRVSVAPVPGAKKLEVEGYVELEVNIKL